ncbi:MAG: hypothetical protein R6V57_07450 [Vicinamibacterales bacterium]
MPTPVMDPGLPDAWSSRRTRFLAALAVVVAVVARSAVFLWWEQASFDSDQAVTGLMAKHLSEGRAFPLFFYGQNFLLAVQAWLAAPVFLALGPTVLALKLPLLLLNAAAALLLVRVLCDDVGLQPAAAIAAAAFFVLAPPGTAAQLMSALGVSVEPFLYVLLIWMLRERPLVQGLVLGVGFLHREFTAYGFLAILAVAALDRSLFTRARLVRVAATLVTAAAVWAIVWALRPYSSGAGPGTTPLDVAGASNNIQSLAARFCGEPRLIARGFGALLGSYLGLPLGLTPSPLSDFFVNSRLSQGAPWAWPVAGLAGLAALVRVVWLIARRGVGASMAIVGAAVYLFLVGAIAAAAYNVGRCGDLHVLTVRYMLLFILAPVGLAAAWLRLEPKRALRGAFLVAIGVWTAASLTGHARLADEYLRHTPPAHARALADYLVEHRIRLVRTDYWTGYRVAFLSQERVVTDTDGVWRVLQYHQWATERPRSTSVVGRSPCQGRGDEAVPGVYWVCPPPD